MAQKDDNFGSEVVECRLLQQTELRKAGQRIQCFTYNKFLSICETLQKQTRSENLFAEFTMFHSADG